MINTIKSKLIISFILLAIVPIFLAAVSLSLKSYNIFMSQTLVLQNESASKIANLTSNYIKNLENELSKAILYNDFFKLKKEKVYSILSQLTSLNNQFEEITLLDNNGQEIYKYHILNVYTDKDLHNKSQNSVFVIPKKFKTTYFGPITTSESSGEQFMLISVPILEPHSGNFQGTLIAQARLEKLWDLLAVTYKRPGESLYIIDNSNNRIIAHQNPSVVLKGSFFKLPESSTKISQGFNNEKAIIGFKTVNIGLNKFTVVSERNYKNALEFALSEITFFTIIISLSLAFAIFMGIFVTIRIIRPIAVLSNATSSFASGNLSERVPEKGSDELTMLCKNFNTMAQNLEDTLNGLESEILDRKHAENSLKINEERLKYALEASSDGIWDINLHTNKTYLSYRWFKMIGYLPWDFKDTGKVWFELMHPDDKITISPLFDQFCTGVREDFEVTYRILTKLGNYKWMQAKGKIVERFNNGTPKRVIGTQTDITSRVEYEMQLQEKTKALESVNKKLNELVLDETNKRVSQERLLMQQSKMAAMGEMIGAIAHQWRQPLNSIGLLIQEIKILYNFKELDEASINNLSADAVEILQHMSNTIDDFRNFFGNDKDITEFDLLNSIYEIVNMVTAQMSAHGITINIMINDYLLENDYQENTSNIKEFNNIKVKGNKNEFKHVILNLVQNSKDAFDSIALKEDKICNINILTSDSSNTLILFNDNAGGIQKDLAERIFEPYFTTKEEGKGVGIGLYMAKMIIENNMHGKITQRNSNEGAEFVIVLPKPKST